MDTKIWMGIYLCVLGVLCGKSAPRALSRPEVLFAVEAQRDRFQYHFANPSSFDTPAPVPHVFEQPVELTLDGGRTWSYQSDARLADAQFGVRLAAGRAW
jgi:hypothetical protein